MKNFIGAFLIKFVIAFLRSCAEDKTVPISDIERGYLFKSATILEEHSLP